MLAKTHLTRMMRSMTSRRQMSYMGNKVSIVGVGAVGMACAMSIARDNIASEIALYDMNESKVMGEVIDMSHAVPFYKSIPPHITGSSDIRVTSGSNLVVVACGARQNDGESRLSLVDRNIAIFQKMIPALVEQSPNAVFLVPSRYFPCLLYSPNDLAV